jgi:DNA processing protein
MSATPPPEAYAAALSALPMMTIPRLLGLLRHHEPEHAFAIARGDATAPPDGIASRVLSDGGVRAAWRRAACGEPERTWERCRELGLTVTVLGGAAYPPVLVDDPLPPPVLFSRGRLELLSGVSTGRRVGIVGTRNATSAGRSVAHEIAASLAAAGVHVVSGLAKGIDAAAHRGCLDLIAARRGAPTTGSTGDADVGRAIAVVGTGADVVYPRHNAELWERVATEGLLLTEMPPGTRPEPFRFPLRNRIVAALSEVVVVVESRERGGSLITATLAAERGVPVMAVPGSAANRAAMGTNALIREGAAPVLGAADILLALDLDHSREGPVFPEQRPRPRGCDVATYRSCARRPMTIGEVAAEVGCDLVAAAMSLARLEQAGWLVQADGWYEANGSPL